jgi:hypothetical protein
MSGKNSAPSVWSSLGMALLGTTCCALPALLVVLGAGGAVASLLSAAPWLAALSAHKILVFLATGAMLGYSWWRLRKVAAQCSLADAKPLRWQRRILWGSTIMLGLSLFAAYAAVPIAEWLER